MRRRPEPNALAIAASFLPQIKNQKSQIKNAACRAPSPNPRRHLGDRKFPGVRSKLVGMDYAKDFLERRTLPDARGKKGLRAGERYSLSLARPNPFYKQANFACDLIG